MEQEVEVRMTIIVDVKLSKEEIWMTIQEKLDQAFSHSILIQIREESEIYGTE